MGDILAVPPATHFIYVPFVLVIGIIIGFVMGRKAGIKQGEAEMLVGADDDDLL